MALSMKKKGKYLLWPLWQFALFGSTCWCYFTKINFWKEKKHKQSLFRSTFQIKTCSSIDFLASFKSTDITLMLSLWTFKNFDTQWSYYIFWEWIFLFFTITTTIIKIFLQSGSPVPPSHHHHRNHHTVFLTTVTTIPPLSLVLILSVKIIAN